MHCDVIIGSSSRLSNYVLLTALRSNAFETNDDGGGSRRILVTSPCIAGVDDVA